MPTMSVHTLKAIANTIVYCGAIVSDATFSLSCAATCISSLILDIIHVASCGLHVAGLCGSHIAVSQHPMTCCGSVAYSPIV